MMKPMQRVRKLRYLAKKRPTARPADMGAPSARVTLSPRAIFPGVAPLRGQEIDFVGQGKGHLDQEAQMPTRPMIAGRAAITCAGSGLRPRLESDAPHRQSKRDANDGADHPQDDRVDNDRQESYPETAKMASCPAASAHALGIRRLALGTDRHVPVAGELAGRDRASALGAITGVAGRDWGRTCG